MAYNDRSQTQVGLMAKPNYSFEKRQRELAKQKKQDEKEAKKRAEREAAKAAKGDEGDEETASAE
ncbi:MAG: hypothetical protein ABIQ62_04735 [Thermomonas sp.]